jgi:exodeoxyribonuclease VII large subunit
MNREDSSRQYLTISELAQLLDLTLQEYVGEVVFLGEVHEVSEAQSGHIYLSLKDEDSKIRAVIWSSNARKLDFKLAVGMSVLCTAHPNVYNRSGQLQLIIRQIEQYGEGLLHKKFLQLKNKLEAEGLFAPDRKRKLPLLPKAVGLVTSADGAALHDIMTRIKERMPSLVTYLIDARVQGNGSAEDIASGIKEFNRLKNVDVIIVARGGGSLEDLWSFNEELVVRTIFASSIPVVSGVGHETDITLSDLVADVRAPTPTAAAEIVVPSRKELLRRIDDLERRVKSTDKWLEPAWQAVDELSMRLNNSMKLLTNNYIAKVNQASSELKSIEPSLLVKHFSDKISHISLNLNKSFQNYKQLKIARLDFLSGKLESLSHKKVLERGYSVVKSKGKLVQDASLLEINQNIEIQMRKGEVLAKVENIKE